jgi:superoxide dismutase
MLHDSSSKNNQVATTLSFSRVRLLACLQVKNNAGGLWNHALFFLHNLAPAGSQVSYHLGIFPNSTWSTQNA